MSINFRGRWLYVTERSEKTSSKAGGLETPTERSGAPLFSLACASVEVGSH